MPSPADPETRLIDVDAGQLYVESAGSGKSVLLIHSGITDCRMWDGQFPVLAADRQVVRYDLRGFGRSSAVSGPFSHVDDLSRVIEALALDRPSVVAASMGARVAVDFSLRDLSRIDRLLLVGPAISGMRFEDERLRACWTAMSEAWDAGDKERVIDIETRFWINGPGRTEGSADEAVIERVGEMQRRIIELLPDDEDDPEIEEPQEALGRLDELSMPVLVVVGEHDVSDMHRNAEAIRSDAPNARVTIIPDTGHLPNMEAVDEFNITAREFLR